MHRSAALILSVLVLSAAAAPSGGARRAELRRYDTPYYVVHTDLPPPAAAEAVARMARLGDELRRRTRELGFAGRITARLPFYLYARHGDYVAATGAPRESAGVFFGDRLVAAAADARGGAAWHVVQHEAFHQFPHAAPGTPLPPWLDEGLAEYFGEALFTGDGYATGIIPEWRAERVRESIGRDAFPPPGQLALLSQEDWNRDMSLSRYDHAWSLVQFLLHGEGGRHRERLVAYVTLLGAGEAAPHAWAAAFSDWPDLEARWRRYWLGLPPEATRRPALEAAVATLASFVARAAARGQRFDDFDAFRDAARSGTLRRDPQDWLPPSLLGQALETLPAGVRFGLAGEGEGTRVVATTPDGARVVGRFKLADGRVARVWVEAEQRAGTPAGPGSLHPKP